MDINEINEIDDYLKSEYKEAKKEGDSFKARLLESSIKKSKEVAN